MHAPLTAPVHLNPEQLSAVTHLGGPLLILAGAGTGKTRVLVHRIAHLIETRRARPWEIFAVTFTNKAADEMSVRLGHLIGPAAVRDLWIGTFHRLAGRMLRMEGERLGFSSDFTIYDDQQANRLLKKVVEEMRIDVAEYGATHSSIELEIERAKNHALGPEAFAASVGADDEPARVIAKRVYPKYQAALRRANAMDFGDMLLHVVDLLRNHEASRARFARKWRHVLVDEFQDTNAAQYEMLKLIAPHRNLAVVGDDDQAIYRWRGADVRNILEFDKAFAGATVVTLEQNYRSTANILDAANAVISRNTRRHPKELFTENELGAAVGVDVLETGEAEAESVANKIADGLAAGRRPDSFAVLYRANAQSRAFEEALRRRSIPFRLIGGPGFYARAEVKDLLAYLRLIANPKSSSDFDRIVNVPRRGIGERSVAEIRVAVEGLRLEGSEMLDAEPHLRTVLAPATMNKVRGLRSLLRDVRELAMTASAAEVAKEVVRRTDYLRHLERAEPTSSEERVGNVMELIAAIAEHEATRQDPDQKVTPLAHFLQTAALASTSDVDAEGAVSLITLHSAKGLEFDEVFLVGLEEGTFPSKQAVDAGGVAIDEERRLCYVGMTRAREKLHLTAARERRLYGHSEARWPSRFLIDVPGGARVWLENGRTEDERSRLAR